MIMVLCFAGCATVPKDAQVQPKEIIFYPPPPDEPRIQFLTSFSSSEDIEGNPSGFSKFIFGDVPKKEIVKPYGVKMFKGRIYVCDTVAATIEIIDLAERKLGYFFPKGKGRLMSPINLDISPDGKMYVADSRRGQVVIFDKDQNYTGAIGMQGELKPTDVAVWKDHIFVCDLKSRTIRVYDAADLKFVKAIPGEGEAKPEAKMFSPINIDLDAEGNLYVSDMGAFNIKKFAVDGTFVRSFGEQGDAGGHFSRPKGIALDREGRIYAVDASFENIQIFDQEGNFLLFFPGTEDQASMVLPAGVTVDYDNVESFRPWIAEGFKVEYLILATGQYGEHKVNVFGFGKKE